MKTSIAILTILLSTYFFGQEIIMKPSLSKKYSEEKISNKQQEISKMLKERTLDEKILGLQFFYGISNSNFDDIRKNRAYLTEIQLNELKLISSDEVIKKRTIQFFKNEFLENQINDLYAEKIARPIPIFKEKPSEKWKGKLKIIKEKLKQKINDKIIAFDTENYQKTVKKENKPNKIENGFYKFLNNDTFIKNPTINDLEKTPKIGSKSIKKIELKLNQSYDYQVNIWLDDAQKLENLTKKNILKRIAIVANDEIIIAPIVREIISTKKLTISGNLNYIEANELKSKFETK